jgi:branched-chain amino acid transport system substrate-binding protein
VGFLFLLLASCQTIPGTDEELNLTVIVIGPFSGDMTALGQSMRNGIVLATEEKNASGGLLGRNVVLSLYDSDCNYTKAREVTLQAIRETGANYILGAVCGTASEGVAQVAEEQGVLVINPASVREGLVLDVEGNVRPLVFRVPFVDPDQGVAAAMIAYDSMNAKTASILVAEESEYESSLADAFETKFIELGGEVLLRDSYERMSDSFYDVLSEIREANAEIIYAPGYFDVISKIAGQARLYGINELFIGSDGWDSELLDTDNLEGSYFTTQYSGKDPRTVLISWLDKYEERYLIQPDTIATLSYDAANILFTAIERTATTAPYELSAAMQDMTFDAVSGEISFDEMHNPRKSVVVMRILNGQVMYNSRIDISEVIE